MKSSTPLAPLIPMKYICWISSAVLLLALGTDLIKHEQRLLTLLLFVSLGGIYRSREYIFEALSEVLLVQGGVFRESRCPLFIRPTATGCVDFKPLI